MYVVIEEFGAKKVEDLVKFYVEELSNSSKENLIQDIKRIINGNSIKEIIESYNAEVLKVEQN
jgi:hypothetical protein